LVARIGIGATKREKQFLRSICRDLNTLDHPLEYREYGPFAQLVGGFRGGNSEAVATAVQKRTLDTSDEEFQRIENEFYEQFFATLRQVDIAQVKPELTVNQVRRNDTTLRYLRHFQNIRSGPGVGEPILALVRDGGNPDRPLMGAVALGYPAYFQGERDFFFGWRHAEIAKNATAVRERGLRRIAQMTVFVAVPPYDRLDAVRLLAPIPFTKDAMAVFKKSRNTVLSATVCTAALRDHLPALEKHSVSFLRDTALSKQGSDALYLKVEVPVRKRMRLYDVISEETKAAARSLWNAKSSFREDESLRTWKRELHRAFRVTALPLALLDTNSIATYIGALSEEHIDSLRFNARPPIEDGLAFDRVVSSWQQFLQKRNKLGSARRLVIPDSRRLLVSSRLFNRKAEGPAVLEEE
jgi:hypothetical protein